MPINQLQLPTYAAPQSVDFSSLANLGSIYEKAQAKRGLQEALAGGVDTANPQSLSQLAARVLPYDATTGLSLAQLGNTAQNRQQDIAWRQEEAQRAQKNADRSFGLQARAADRADEGPLEKMQARLKVLQANGIDPASPEGRAYAISGEWSGPGTGGASLTPVFGVGADGKPAMIQPTKSGVAIQTKVPDGFQISKEPIKIDGANGTTLLDPQTRQTIGFVPKNLAAAEVEKAGGEATGAAQVALPQVIANSQEILNTIDRVKNHPGKDWSLGMYSKLPTIPGTEQANFRTSMDQLQGQSFLQAYQTLRGGGAITEIEGKKGTDALARMNTAQTKASFDEAADEFKNVVKSGMLRASAKARGPGAQQQSNPQRPQQGISQEEYAALPSGTPFTAPDGTQRIKP